MLDHESFDDGGDGTVFRDVIMLALLGFVTIVVLLLPHLNPPTLADEEVVAPGNVIVEVRWADGLNARSDGLFWPSEDFFPDGVHQTDPGKEKAATLLLEFFKTSPQTRCWFLVGETC